MAENLLHQINTLYSRPEFQKLGDFQLSGAKISRGKALEPGSTEQLSSLIESLRPWRTGPFELCGHKIDSEWDSSKKWARIRDRLLELKPRSFVDVGASNGYLSIRAALELSLAGNPPERILALDRNERNRLQFLLLSTHTSLPITFITADEKSLESSASCFDVAFALGVLYHQRNELAFLTALKNSLIDGGRAFIETLVLPPEVTHPIVSPPRYLGMPNVHFVHTEASLRQVLSSAGFIEIEFLDTSRPSHEEQHRTIDAPGFSLADFLHPTNPAETIESLPAPLRATLICRTQGP